MTECATLSFSLTELMKVSEVTNLPDKRQPEGTRDVRLNEELLQVTVGGYPIWELHGNHNK